MSDYTTCEEGVTRRQAFQPCDKPAVAMRLDPEDKKPYPVCRRHCRENMVPLAEVKAQACTHTFAQQLEEHSLAELIRMAKAEAWEEGLEAKFKLLEGQDSISLVNPYRHGETE